MNMFLSFVFGEQYTNQLRDNVSYDKFAVTKLLIQESKKLISYC